MARREGYLSRESRLIHCGGGTYAAVGIREVAGVRDEPQEHGDFALDVDFAIDIPGVRLDRAGLDLQDLGDFAVSQALADELGDFSLAGRQLIAALDEGPLLFVEQDDFGAFAAEIGTAEIVGMWVG